MYYQTKVAGVTYDNRQAALERCRTNMAARIEPEPENAFDKNALAVKVATSEGVVEHVGYVPKDLAAVIAPRIQGENIPCEILEITGGFIKFDGSRASLGLIIGIELPEQATA